MAEIWHTLFLAPLVNGLIFLYNFTGNLGISIVLFTILVRLVLTPFALPAMKTAQKMKELSPQLNKLKERHKGDKAKLTQAQMDLYRQYGVNPAAGCLPQVVQIVILFALIGAFNTIFYSGTNVISKLNEFLWPVLDLPTSTHLNTSFLYLDLSRPDSFSIAGIPLPVPGPLIILAALAQLISSLMIMPSVEKEKEIAQKTPDTMDDFSTSMQQSMLWIFPLTTIIIGIKFPSGLVLYWTTISLFQLVQQYFVSGWGGVIPLTRKLGLKIKS